MVVIKPSLLCQKYDEAGADYSDDEYDTTESDQDYN